MSGGPDRDAARAAAPTPGVLRPASSEQLGATVGADGTTFVVASSVAERIELSLWSPDATEDARIDLHPDRPGATHPHPDPLGRAARTWRVTVAGAGAGQAYGFRVHGPADRSIGHACDPAKLLVDPAARRVVGELRRAPDLVRAGVDSADLVPRSVVVGERGPHRDDPGGPATPWDRTVIYEAHVGHLTARHPMVPPEDRGRYRGLAHPAVVSHLVDLGVTAVQLMPVQHFVSEPELVAAGRRNVWGYNPLAWRAPHQAYARPDANPVAELRETVAALHRGGLEVLLDVVFNHTCEGSLGSGAVLSWRGFDNADAYRLRSEAAGAGLVDDDVTGCGNSIDARSGWMRRLIREALVGWVEDYGIDGFRFDLASTLARGDDGFDPEAPLLAELADEPALAAVKLIAEPWDVGPGGYAVGRFPAPWREWNDRFRDDIGDLWRGRSTWAVGAGRVTGSADIYAGTGRGVTTSVNAVATHDGFTVADLVAYDPPQGGHGPRSWGSGADGPTTDTEVQAVRRRRQRALLGTVAWSLGVPMILSGDELGRSQGGVADGYTLDPDSAGVDWAGGDQDLCAWVAEAIALRRGNPALRWNRWLDPNEPGLVWRSADGTALGPEGWQADGRALVVTIDSSAGRGHSLLIAANAADASAEATLPAGVWEVLLDAGWDRPRSPGTRPRLDGGLPLAIAGWGLWLARPVTQGGPSRSAP